MPNTCSHCTVRKRAICHSLATPQRDELIRSRRLQDIKAGQTLIWEGDDSSLVGSVVEGMLKLSHSSADGRGQTLGLVYASDFIGRAFGKRSSQTVTAITDARVCMFRRNAFDDFARRHPAFEHDLLERTLEELDRVREWMVLLGTMSASERLVTFLNTLGSRLGEPVAGQPGSIHISLPFGRQEIADILSLTIETVSRQITALRIAGIIDTPDRRTVVLHNRTIGRSRPPE